MKTAQIPAYKKGIKKWLEIDENENRESDWKSLSAQERNDAKESVLSVARAYCNFQDIVSGKQKIKKTNWEKEFAKWDRWVKENENV